ncbi:CU044_5270 family protein [Lentzea sp. NPDC051838]|uniref:CU044_5270 family protein n=1 Tax=Lentzea sp. NPDC051838 TaxID=3154849 RepID=UPI003438F5D9
MRDEKRPVEDETVKWAMSDVAPMSDEAFARGRNALLARIDAEESGAEAGKVVPFRRWRRIPLVAAAAAAVVIAGAALLVPSLTSRPSGPNVAAAEVLNKVAGLTGDVKLQPGQYLYVREYGKWSNTDGNDHKWMFLSGQLLETWIPADQRGTWLHRRTNTDEDEWLIGSPADLPPDMSMLDLVRESGEWRVEGGSRWFGGKIPVSFQDPTPEYIASLPQDPQALYDKLQSESYGKNLVLMVTNGLDTGLYPAEVRSAVYKALAHLPGLEVVDQAATIDGRTGTALGLTSYGTSYQIVVNPNTGEYLGSRAVQAEDEHGLKAGTVTSSSSVTTKVVSAMGATS